MSMENCICFNLRWVTRAVTQYFDRELRRHGLRPTQTPILAALAAKGEAGMAELSDWLGMERTTLVRNLRPLERQGWVVAHGTGRGGRVTLAITPRGRETLAKMQPAWQAAQKAVLKTLGEARWTSIMADLDRAALALSERP